MSKCQGIMGAIFGHKFSPRYNEGKPLPYTFKDAIGSDMVQVIQASKPITYRRDVCERCGQTIEEHNKQEA